MTACLQVPRGSTGWKVWLIWHRPGASQKESAYLGNVECHTLAQFLEKAQSPDSRVLLMGDKDLLILPTMARHAVLTVWLKDTPLTNQWCVLGGRNFATRADLDWAGKMMDPMGVPGRRCNAQGDDGWSLPWQHLWRIFLLFNPQHQQVKDTKQRVQLLRGPRKKRVIIGSKRKRQAANQPNLAKANAVNPKKLGRKPK